MEEAYSYWYWCGTCDDGWMPEDLSEDLLGEDNAICPTHRTPMQKTFPCGVPPDDVA